MIARYGESFCAPGDRRVTLNFALARDVPLSPTVIADYFDPEIFLIKITPVNPTVGVVQNGIRSALQEEADADGLAAVHALRDLGYEVIVSIGEGEENLIGSNCGQYVQRFLEGDLEVAGSYGYRLAPGSLSIL
jgi:23S rRNA (adenine2503-C2)-methyltransferase